MILQQTLPRRPWHSARIGKGTVEGNSRGFEVNSFLPPKKGEDQAENNADDNAGDDWEVKRGVSALNPDIARETAQPTGAEPTPQEGSDQEDHDPDDDEKFSDFGHRVHFAPAGAGGRRINR